MLIEVALGPWDLGSIELNRRAIVVFDVLRATTTMAAALAAGIREIRVLPDVQAARQAARQFGADALLCGEVGCLPPEGFDLGNSPGAFSPHHAGRVLFMATTNGTRAITAATAAHTLLVGALVNASAVADLLARLGMDILLLCAGTNGRPAMEDLLGAGAVIRELRTRRHCQPDSDLARLAIRFFDAARHDLPAVLRDSQGGRNVIAAGLDPDISFAARLNSLNVVGQALLDPLRITKAEQIAR